jgi:iron complex outermembrane receptor protein
MVSMRFLLRPKQAILVLFLIVAGAAFGQETGAIEGSVLLMETGEHLHAATVHVEQLGRTRLVDDQGQFRFEDIPPGTYDVVAHAASTFTEEHQTVVVEAGQTATINFELALAIVRQQVTVTASGVAQSTLESFQSVETRDSFELAQDIAPALGETLANRPGNGIAKRSFGPGTERPIIRGFDGDRVMIMQDGVRTGTLSSQSGDHGEMVNSGNLDRIEIVKGPAALLYGGSAVGGVVNTISRHHEVHEHAHEGLRGQVSGTGGSANGFASGSAGFEYGFRRWMVWGGGSGQSSGEYSTPEGKVPNSDTRMNNGYGGFGWYGEKTFVSFGTQYDDGVYGVPFANELHAHDEVEGDEPGGEDEHGEGLARVELDARRQNHRLSWGLRNLSGAIDNFVLRLNYSRWMHDEIEVAEDGGRQVGTSFDNKQYIYRGTFEQAERGPLTGRFGFWGMARDYSAVGEEALSPPVNQIALAGFALEELDFERVKLQLGGRVEYNNYDPEPRAATEHEHVSDEAPPTRPRSFTGGSAAAGVHVELWEGGVFVTNYTHSYRPPALEELYNFGPHVGSLAFEVGDPNLNAERGNGFDISLRHTGRRARLEGNFFYYDFDNFIFPYNTGEFEHGLQVLRFIQADSRFLGTEANLDLGLRNDLWLNLGLDYVSTEEKETGTSLPRIPPLRGRIGFDWHWKGLEVKPELVLADRQDRTFPGETPTAGYVVADLKASYTFSRGRLVHQIAVNSFNLGDTLYRNHSSFIKDLAPEIGRGIRITYRVRFF